jgi:hypothetical protein
MKVGGVQTWKTWLGFLRSVEPDLELVDATAEMEDDGRIHLRGRWRAGGRTADYTASAWYRVRGGRITEIWTKSDNYTFILGPSMEQWYGKYLATVRAGWWKRGGAH